MENAIVPKILITDFIDHDNYSIEADPLSLKITVESINAFIKFSLVN